MRARSPSVEWSSAVEYLFLLIFLFFIILNVVIGLVSSRSKKRRVEKENQKTGVQKPERIREIPGQQQKQGGSYESLLQPQTADNIVEALYEVEDERASLPGGEVTPPTVQPAVQEVAEEKQYPEYAAELARVDRTRADQPRPMIDLTDPSSRAKLPLEEEPLESEVEARVIEEQKEQEEKFRVYGSPVDSEIGVDVWELINNLPALQRAVVLSEVLGAPRALSEGYHSDHHET